MTTNSNVPANVAENELSLPAFPVDYKLDRYDDDTLREIKTFEDAFQVLGDEYRPEDYADAYGTGFEVLPKTGKRRLVENPFAVLEWRFTQSADYGGIFVSCQLVTKGGEKMIMNDGSTGICKQLLAVTNKRLSQGATPEQATRGLLVRGGLRVSDYTTEATDAKTGEVLQIEGTTYYLAN